MNRSPKVDALLDQGLMLHRQGQLQAARERYQALLELAPDHARAWHLLAVIALQSNEPQAALLPLANAVKIEPENLAALKDYARALLAAHRLDAAISIYQQALALAPADPELHLGCGNGYFELKNFGEALASYDAALRLDPAFAGGHFNRAMACLELSEHQAALQGFDAALRLDPEHARAHNFRGVALAALKRPEAAVASFDAALRLRADDADAHLNRGLALFDLEAFPAALASFDEAIKLAPLFADAHNNRGNALYQLGRLEEALSSYTRATELAPNLPGLQFNRAQMLAELYRHDEAVARFDRVLELNPSFQYAAGEALLARLAAGDWRDFAARREALHERLSAGEAVATPFALLALSDSPQVQQQAARGWMRTQVAPAAAMVKASRPSRRFVIGYFSPDFREHPVARLAAPLFAAHDRTAFEILAFSFGPHGEDAMRARIRSSVDDFIDVAAMPAREVAALAVARGVDVAVDLAGLTKHCRPAIFAARAAPVQASYLGFLGTVGAPFMDYLIADKHLVSESCRCYYDEKLAYLPGYHVNDSVAPDLKDLPSRHSLGVPQNAFVFGCFNSPYKITPETFTRWMRILTRAPHAVLMLQADEDLARRYQDAAQTHNVDPNRLIFGGRLALSGYLARLGALDLFLDTFPYNAGTTASDALLAGVPLLTLSGNTFASCAAASALQAVGLPELICRSAEEYEALAVSLALDPRRAADLKSRLGQRRAAALLFDAKRFTPYLEQALLTMIRRNDEGLAPQDFEIQA